MKVLIVEDDPKVASFLQRAFVEEGYTTDLCRDGAVAVTQAASGIYDLVLLDWMLPSIDGLEACRRLRRDGCSVPILMLTARGELREKVLGFDAGVDDYLVKPFEVEELLVRVQALLRRAAGQTQLRVGPLTIDLAARAVSVDGRAIELTTREFRVLEHLARNAGRTVTRTSLLSHVWATQFDPESNIVEVHVSHVRDKLGRHAWMIQTVRGRGYRLRGDRGW